VGWTEEFTAQAQLALLRQLLLIPTSRQQKARYPNFLYAVLERITCAPFIKERRMKLAEPISFTGNSGVWGTLGLWLGKVPKLQGRLFTNSVVA
jgi:hypothetical protein